MLSTTILALTLPAPAWGCGGFFCNTNQPVDQSAERILFAVREDIGEIDMHVQISYQGTDATDFAWVVPIPSNPQLSLSTDALFQELAWRTAPQFDLGHETNGRCEQDGSRSDVLEAGGGGYYNSGGGDDADYDSGVVVVSEQEVGPYDTVVLRAQSAAELLDWLQTHDYDLPDALEPKLDPYVSTTGHFVALRLLPGKGVGDLAPLALRYQADRIQIPIRLTSIAAVPDMRLEVYVLGDHRAVPESYLHVRINPLAIDWEAAGANYDDVITLAADEAGGHAFATDWAGKSEDAMAMALYWNGRFDLDRLRGQKDPISYMDEIIDQGFPADDAMLQILREFIPKPPELSNVDETDFYNCLECYEEHLDMVGFDHEGMTLAIEDRIVTPLSNAQSLFDDFFKLSRLTSSLDAVEMTVDPVFVFNPDMAAVSGKWFATLFTECGDEDYTFDEAPMILDVEGAFAVHLPSRAWLRDAGMTIHEYMAELGTINAQFIEKTGASGSADLITDQTGALAKLVDKLNRRTDALFDDGKRCGCASGAAPTGGVGLLFALLFGISRRRSAS